MSVKSELGRQLAPKVTDLAPGITDNLVREALRRAINGVGPLPGAAEAARRELAEHNGNVEAAIRDIIETHVRYAGAQGFLTNIGGVAVATVAIPANITGLALVQCRMIAAIAHLHGYDLADPRVRNAVLISTLGEDHINKLVKNKMLPAPPMALATAPLYDADLDQVVSAEVASELIARVLGKRLANFMGRRIPIVGGMVGLTVDGYATWKVGRYADREFLPRARR